MITKEKLERELNLRIAGIKPGRPTTTDFVINEMKSLLILVKALKETK